MRTEIRNEYLNYLKSLIGNTQGYDILIQNLFKREFYSPLERDQNRAAYGLLLRDRFTDIHGLNKGDLSFIGPCTVLEMIIALAENIDTYGTIEMTVEERRARWFWLMISNLGLDALTDGVWDLTEQGYFDHRMDIFLERKYAANGYGGLFPLQFPKADQRKVEIWFQMQSYFLEKNGDVFATAL